MKIEIGMLVRLPYWTDCALLIKDMGYRSFVGDIIDIRTNAVRYPDYIGYYVQKWLKVMTVQDIINA